MDVLRPFSAKGYSLQLNLQPEAAALLSLSGIRYRTKPLEITCLEASGGSSGSGSGAGGAAYAAGAGIARELPPHIKSQLQQALVPLYNAQAQMLQCDQLSQRLAAAADSSTLRIEWTNLSFVNTVAHIIKDNFPQVVTVSLDQNGLTSLHAFKNLSSLCPSIRNLSLANNAIASAQELEALSGLQLRELRLMGNPVLSTEGGDKLAFHGKIKAIFPSLTLLDGEEPKSLKIAFNIPVPKSLPAFQGNFVEKPGMEGVVKQFVTAFFGAYDTNRNSLLGVYMDSCFFSLTLPGRKKEEGGGGGAASGGWHGSRPSGADQARSWAERGTMPPTEARPYADSNRNLLESGNKGASTKLQVKKLSVVALLDKLPMTKHDLSSFVADAFMLPNPANPNVDLCQVMVCGRFQEQVWPGGCMFVCPVGCEGCTQSNAIGRNYVCSHAGART